MLALFGSKFSLRKKSLDNIGKRGTMQCLRKKHSDWIKADMISYTGFSKAFVYKHWNADSLEDKPRCGAPRTARTERVMKKIGNSRGKMKDNSTRTVSKELSTTTILSRNRQFYVLF